jgi:hypothetical protein
MIKDLKIKIEITAEDREPIYMTREYISQIFEADAANEFFKNTFDLVDKTIKHQWFKINSNDISN